MVVYTVSLIGPNYRSYCSYMLELEGNGTKVPSVFLTYPGNVLVSFFFIYMTLCCHALLSRYNPGQKQLHRECDVTLKIKETPLGNCHLSWIPAFAWMTGGGTFPLG